MKKRLPFRIFPLLLSFVLVFTVFTIETKPAQAFAPAIPIVAGVVICGTALVAAGLVFSEQGSFDAAVEAFMDALPSGALEALDFAVDSSKLMLSALTGKYFLSTAVPDTLWSAARSWVTDNFVVGDNSSSSGGYSGRISGTVIYTGATTIYIVLAEPFVLYNPIDSRYGNVTMYAGDVVTVSLRHDEPKVTWYESRYGMSGEITRNRESNRFMVVSNEAGKCVIAIEEYASYTWNWVYQNQILDYSFNNASAGPVVNVYDTYVPGLDIDVWGDTQVGVGVDDWTWENTHTGDRSVSIPLEMDSEKSLPYVGPTNTLAVNWDDVYAQLLEADYAKVAAIEAGISVPLELADSEAVAVAEGLAPGVSGLNKSIDRFMPVLQDFAMNLLSLYMWVPEQTRVYIGVALSISLLAVLYKIVRP